MKTLYSKDFKEQALNKVLSRGCRTVQSVAEELNISVYTLKGWMREMPHRDRKDKSPQEKSPQDWSLEERLAALQESYGLQDEALHAWCRGKGLFAHHLESWRSAFCEGADKRDDAQERRQLKEENQQLKREVARKEKALAEAAALLVLQKKFQALWEAEAK